MLMVEHERHSKGANNAGGSNFAFCDGNVRYLRFGGELSPINLWAVEPEWRGDPTMVNTGSGGGGETP
jgi:prepilin-type processing-associated H-X9-DG protein